VTDIQASNIEKPLVSFLVEFLFSAKIAGVCLTFAGEYERGIECIYKSIEMAPVYPGWFQFVPFTDYFLKGKYEKALVEARKINMPGWFWDPLMRAATLGKMDRIKQAQAAYCELLAINPDFEAYCELLAINPDFEKNSTYYINAVLMDDTLIERLFEGLYRAGLSEIKSP
jgi:tetratricopeptide (TPR) repeat protein